VGKWLCEDPTAESFQTADVVGKSWVSVKKCAQRHQIFPGKSITAVPVTESIDQGCNVELTQLETMVMLGGVRLKPLAKMMEHLQAVASCVFKSYRGSNLQAKDSYAYPSWLCVAISAPLAHLQEHLITLATYQPF